MDSDAIGPLLAVGGTALALLGRHRRAGHDAPTVGERVSGTTNGAIDAVTGTAQKAGTGITDLSVTGTALVMGTSVAGAAGIARAAGHATTTVVTGVAELVGHGASRSGGLVLDGGVFLLDGLLTPLRGRHRPPAPRATPAARLVVAPAPVAPVPEPAAPTKKAAAKKRAAKRAPAKKAAAKKAPAKKAVAPRKAPVKKAATPSPTTD
jgi:hypothetical protein